MSLSRFSISMSVMGAMFLAQACARSGDSADEALLTFRVEPRDSTPPRLLSDAFSALSLPTTVDGFNCLVANVMGTGIPERGTEQVPAVMIDRLLANQGSCTYTGVSSKPILGSQSQTVELRVPKGSDRLVHVVGVKDVVGNICNSQEPGWVNGDPQNDFIDVGHVKIDVFGDRSVDITNTYASATSGSVDCGPQKYSDEVLADGPLLYWKMNESTGSSLVDATGHAPSLISYADSASCSTSSVATGPLAIADPRSIQFNPVGTCDASFGCSSPLGTCSYNPNSTYYGAGHEVTFEAWVKPSSNTGTQTLFALGMSSNVMVEAAIGGNWFLGNSGYTCGTFAPTGSQLLSTAKWNHWVATHDGSTVKYYLNGELITSQNCSITFATISSNGCILVGSRANSVVCTSAPNFSYNYSGQMAEVAFYPKALPFHRIRAHYRARGHW